MKKRACLLIFFICLQALYAKSQSIESVLKDELKKLNLKDPKKDLARNLEHNNTRFIGIYGYTIVLPGVTLKYQHNIMEKYGVKVIKGTSDKIESSLHAILTEKAYNYAQKYNTALINVLRGNPKTRKAINRIITDPLVKTDNTIGIEKASGLNSTKKYPAIIISDILNEIYNLK